MGQCRRLGRGDRRCAGGSGTHDGRRRGSPAFALGYPVPVSRFRATSGVGGNPRDLCAHTGRAGGDSPQYLRLPGATEHQPARGVSLGGLHLQEPPRRVRGAIG
jgi:hypothetical protein